MENEIKTQTEELLDESMMKISNSLKRLSKVTVKDDFEDKNGTLDFYIDGDENKNRYWCYFWKDSDSKRTIFNFVSKDKSIPSKGFRFCKKEVKKLVDRELFTMFVVENLFKDELTENQLKEYLSDKLGFSIFPDCFKVVRMDDGKPFTRSDGVKGVKPFICYKERYMNQLNGSLCGVLINNLTKYVYKKCKQEYGFELEGGGELLSPV